MEETFVIKVSFRRRGESLGLLLLLEVSMRVALIALGRLLSSFM